MKTIVSLLTCTTLLVILQSCKKSPDSKGSSSVTSNLQIQFSAQTIPLNTIDSVVLTIQKSGGSVYKKMTKGNDNFSVDISDVNGDWPATVNVYAQPSMDVNANTSNAHVYMINKNVSSTSGAQMVTAPTGDLADTWKTCLMLNDADHKITFIIAASPTDPYFEIRSAGNYQWNYVYVDKVAYLQPSVGSNQLVDAGSWENNIAQGSLFTGGKIVNTTNLNDFSLRMATKSWDICGVTCIVDDKTGIESSLYATYSKKAYPPNKHL